MAEQAQLHPMVLTTTRHLVAVVAATILHPIIFLPIQIHRFLLHHWYGTLILMAVVAHRLIKQQLSMILIFISMT